MTELKRKHQTESCPICGSLRVFKDGMRYSRDGFALQRFRCRNCGHRFSGGNKLKNLPCALVHNQICALKVKNLDSATETKTVAGDRKKKPLKIELLPEASRGYVVKFNAYLERNGFDEDITYPQILTRLAGAGADLLDPESVKEAIAKWRQKNGKPWSNSMKTIAVSAYDAFCKMEKIEWERPIYHPDEIEIIAPDEKDLDMLISAASRRFATYLSCLKETFADPSEVLAVEWTELKGNIMYINHPVKRHYPGHYELSARLIGMINALPREDKRIFPTNYRAAANSMRMLRRKVARKFNNPAVLQISLKSFRHWGGSMLAYVTNGNVPEIAKVLRHKSWKSTKRYVHTITGLKDVDFDVTSATALEEILKLGKDGWTKYDEVMLNGVVYHCYRKPKRFGSLKNVVDTPKK